MFWCCFPFRVRSTVDSRRMTTDSMLTLRSPPQDRQQPQLGPALCLPSLRCSIVCPCLIIRKMMSTVHTPLCGMLQQTTVHLLWICTRFSFPFFGTRRSTKPCSRTRNSWYAPPLSRQGHDPAHQGHREARRPLRRRRHPLPDAADGRKVCRGEHNGGRQRRGRRLPMVKDDQVCARAHLWCITNRRARQKCKIRSRSTSTPINSLLIL